MTRKPVSPAEEAVVAGILGGLIVCVVMGYLVLRLIGEWTTLDAVVIATGSFVVTGYIVPRVVAWWFGKSLDDVFASPN